MNRRRAIEGITAATLLGASRLPGSWAQSRAGAGSFALTPASETFLEDMQRRGCLFFMEQADPATGQVQDRAQNQGLNGALDPRKLSSIAATGFGLSALCVAHRRGYAPAAQIEKQVARTLAFHANMLHHEHGFFCHFNDIHTGEPIAKVEYSSIDTALLLCGVLTARAYFRTNEAIVRDATTIYERVDWPWMLHSGTEFRMGWKTGSGFLDATWNHYCELMMIPLLAMGSPTHAVGPDVWSAWSRPVMDYSGIRYISGKDPLFVHQYSHAWFDFRGKHDAYTDYFQNSVKATEAHRLFCLSLGAPYSPEYWGVSASDSEQGYHAWGGPPKFGDVNGTVVPCASGGSLAFAPAICLQTLQALKQHFGDQAWGRYGLCDAFHPATGWYDPDALGIDVGIALLMAENLRSGFVWEVFSRNPEVRLAMRRAGFMPNQA
ncbi:MAG: glucoamylase family protein [Janthinobacterium lividum]